MEEIISSTITAPSVELLTAPVRFAAGVPLATAEAVFNTFAGDTKTKTSENIRTNIYDLANPRLDQCCLIYLYTELRSATKKLCKAYAKKKGMTFDDEDDFDMSAGLDSQVLYDALKEVDTCSKALDGTPENYARYQESLKKLKQKQEDFNITEGDVEVFKQYFEIISKEPKKYTDIKKEVVLYHKYINPLFMKSFGGKQFNVQAIEDLVDRDETSFVHYIDDDFTSTSLNVSGFINGLQSEVVYAICVSDNTRTISIVFRGSVNMNDWISNLNAKLVDCKFPGYTTEEAESGYRPSFGKVHEGFYTYLFGKTKVGLNGSTKSKGEEIMGKIAALLNDKIGGVDRKGYEIHITGHSLGGALSTLMASRVAAFDQFKTTVINVSFASPYFGDQTFRESFYKWEQAKYIKHLRMSNYEDIVPLIPFVSTTIIPVPFKHVGLNIKLFNKSLVHQYHYHMSYPKKDSQIDAIRNSIHSSIFNGFNLNIFFHLCDEYRKRFDAAKDDLKSLDFDALYGDSNITGWEYDATPPEEEGKKE